MRILFIGNYSDEPAGGTESLETLFDSLQEGGEHDCRFLRRHTEFERRGEEFLIKDRSKWLRHKLPMEPSRYVTKMMPIWQRKFEKHAESFNPDIVVGQGAAAHFAVEYCKRHECKSCIFLRDWQHLYSDSDYHKGNFFLSRILNRYFRRKNIELDSDLLSSADLLIADSNFTAERYKEKTGVDTEVVYEFIDLEKYKVEETGSKILHVNPIERKGINITLELAERMESEEFIIAGTYDDETTRKRAESLNNVTSLGYVEDMREAYKRSKIVLMPSKWEEPFGRIPLEAGISGIPTIASDKGGLSESVGVEDLTVSYDVDQFERKIKEVLSDYKAYSGQVKKNSKEMSLESTVRDFLSIIEES